MFIISSHSDAETLLALFTIYGDVTEYVTVVVVLSSGEPTRFERRIEVEGQTARVNEYGSAVEAMQAALTYSGWSDVTRATLPRFTDSREEARAAYRAEGSDSRLVWSPRGNSSPSQ